MNVDKDTCIGCGACAGVCPVEALAFDDEGKMECDKDTCIGCQHVMDHRTWGNPDRDGCCCIIYCGNTKI